MADTTATNVGARPTDAFDRFIDSIEAVLVKAGPTLHTAETLALRAEPILALTPAGPEYNVAVNAIVGAQQIAQASLAAGVNLNGTQKAALAVQAATPALRAILTSKGVSTGVETTISSWIQTVFNVLAGPVAAVVAAKTLTAAQG